MADGDPYHLERFVAAQRDVYPHALAELRSGRKRTHWMWFVFPQIQGLGRSATARHFAIDSLAEARAYLQHPVLGPRLVQCVEALLTHTGASAAQIFDFPDDLKLRSSMTLFERAASDQPLFGAVLDTFFNGERDAKTVALIADERR